MDNKPPEYFYEEGDIIELSTWSLFSALKFSKYEKYEWYLTKDCSKKVVEYLKWLQIFDNLGEESNCKFV